MMTTKELIAVDLRMALEAARRVVGHLERIEAELCDREGVSQPEQVAKDLSIGLPSGELITGKVREWRELPAGEDDFAKASVTLAVGDGRRALEVMKECALLMRELGPEESLSRLSGSGNGAAVPPVGGEE